jgi:hypothetical protein
MPAVKILRTRSMTAAVRLLVGVASVALFTAGCSSSVSGEASPAPEDRPSASASPSPSRSPGRSGGGGTCQMRVSSNGSIVSSGAGGRTITTNGRTSFSCGRGPLIAIESMNSSGVTFSAEGGAPVTVAPGASSTVGEYQIDVSRADSSGAEFQVAPV